MERSGVVGSIEVASAAAPVDPRVLELVSYIEAITLPLLDNADQRRRIRVEHEAGAFEEYVFRIRVPNEGRLVGFIVGRGGVNAEAIRTLVRARAGALRFPQRVRVDVVPSPV